MLSDEEQSFLDVQVHHLCSILSDHDVVTDKDFSREAWDYMRDERFFGMKIPKEWGGLGFSTHAVSTILAKLATQCFDANATVAVPNSLGPGELLARYGTPEQKEYFLPRLADGTLIPCVALDGPVHEGRVEGDVAGSHAESLVSAPLFFVNDVRLSMRGLKHTVVSSTNRIGPDPRN